MPSRNSASIKIPKALAARIDKIAAAARHNPSRNQVAVQLLTDGVERAEAELASEKGSL